MARTPSTSSVRNWPGLLVKMTYIGVPSRLRGGAGQRDAILGERDVVVQPELAGEAKALPEPFLPQHLLLLPVGLRQRLRARQDPAGALAALAHAAAVLQVRPGKFPDARANDEVGVVRHVLGEGVLALAECHDRHERPGKGAGCRGTPRGAMSGGERQVEAERRKRQLLLDIVAVQRRGVQQPHL